MSDLGPNWKLFPLYGLTITDDDENALHEPIFGAATLVSSAWAGKMATKATGHEMAARALSGATLVSDLGGPDQLQHLGADPKYVVECRPHSYIAVQHQKQKDAAHHAARVRSMLSAAVALRGGLLKAFSPSPLSLAWSTVPVKICEHEGRLTADTRITLNEHTFLRTEHASKAELRRSWLDGSPIPLSTGAHWDISNVHAFTQILCGSSGATTDLKRRLQAGAIQLNEASNIPFPMTQIQMSVSALEMILGTNTFPKLESLIKTFVPNSDDRDHLRRILKARNNFVHEGRVPDAKDQRFLAGKALLIGWVFLSIACGLAERRKTLGGFDEEFEVRLLSQKLITSMDRLGDSDKSEALHRAISQLLTNALVK